MDEEEVVHPLTEGIQTGNGILLAVRKPDGDFFIKVFQDRLSGGYDFGIDLGSQLFL